MSMLIRIVAITSVLVGLYGTVHAPTVGAEGEIAVGDMVVVATTNGDVLTLRAGPGTEYGPLTAFAAGTALHVLAGPDWDTAGSSWYRVSSDDLIGWSAGTWLAPLAVASGTRYISGSDGSVRLRDEPTLVGAILQEIPEGEAVVVLGTDRYADGLDWALVRYGGMTGWLASTFLVGTNIGSDEVSAGPPTPTVGTTLPVGTYAQVVDTDGYDLRIRDGIGLNAPIYSVVPANAVITVVNGPRTDERGASWYGIDYDGVQGWVLGKHLALTQAAPSRRFQSDIGRLSGNSTIPVVSNPTRGAAIVAEAVRYLGTPYVWGGDGPTGWDCSGMIQWVYQQSVGIELPRVSQDQFLVGASLRPDQIEAGDLVFFADTAGPGITHNGIALGDGRFIHARDESSGTVISWLDEPIWVAHYAGARRP